MQIAGCPMTEREELAALIREALRKPASQPCGCFNPDHTKDRRCNGVCEDAVDRVHAALSAAGFRKAGWNTDMESAPRDGTPILVWSEHWMPTNVAVTWWVLGLLTGRKSQHSNAPLVEDGWTNGRGSKLDFVPTAWMPLPQPPEGKTT